jgi:hypothetical protein
MKNARLFFGIFIILIGFLLLLDQWGAPLRLGGFWPFFLLIPGLFFWVEFLSKRQRFGLLMPGTILVLYSAYFFFCEATNYRFSDELSFLFTFAVAAGLFLMYHFSEPKKKGLLVAGWILTGVSLITLISTIGGGQLWPIVLIICGLWLLYQKKNSSGSDQQKPSPETNHTNH